MGSTAYSSRKVDIRGGRLRVDATEDDPAAEVAIGAVPVIVGRDPSCAVVLRDRHVSAVHAELVATERGVRLRDLGSRNGTWIGSARVVEAYLVEPTRVTFGEREAAFDVTAPARVTLPGSHRFGALYGKSTGMQLLFAALAKIAPTALTVLVQGETGSGKELVAQAIHRESARRDRPFVVVDCGAISAGVAESHLFGHERGAFTGAVATRTSPFVEADGGTVFLDELGELPLDLQPKLLRALAERRVQAVGSRRWVEFDVRVVAATRRDLAANVASGAFRSDLYFRVAEARVDVPPLRERTEDIPGLVRELLVAAGAPAGAATRVPRASMARLLRHDWPGNVRELRNAVAVALAFAGDDGPVDVAAQVTDASTASLSGSASRSGSGYHAAKRDALARFERGYFLMLVAEHGDQVAEIARQAGLQRTHVRRYLKAHGLLAPRGERARRGKRAR